MTRLGSDWDRPPPTFGIVVWILIDLGLFSGDGNPVTNFLKPLKIHRVNNDVFVDVADGFTILARISLLPNVARHKEIPSEDFIHQNPHRRNFCIIYRDPYRAVGAQELFEQK